MKPSIRKSLVTLSLVAALGGGVWTTETLLAQGTSSPDKPNRGRKEAHPVLQSSIRQIEAVKDRLQKAPRDFGGHREAAVDALNRALTELHQAIEFDKR